MRFSYQVPVLFVISLGILSAAHGQDDSAPSMGAESAAAPRSCPAGAFSFKVPQPPAGMVAKMSVSLDANCQPVYGPVSFLPEAIVAAAAEDAPAPRNHVELNPVDELSGYTASAYKCFRSSWTLFDPINIPLNQVYGNVCRGWNGTILTSYNVSGGYIYHRELGPAGPGWTPHRAANTQLSGCVGCTSAQFRQHAEFSYKGTFDPTGTVYYNSVNVQETIYGTGAKACIYGVSYRNWSFLWHTSVQCS